jgi:hypothetical protein
VKTAFGTACQLGGIENLHWHDLLHTFGTSLAEAGCSEATIADLMGHSDPQTTRRYRHATDRAKRAAAEAVRVAGDPFCHNPATKQERRPSPIAVNALIDWSGERIRTSDLTVPNYKRGKNVSICLFESCSHQGISRRFTSVPILYHLLSVQ